jgi:hypothetical protein
MIGREQTAKREADTIAPLVARARRTQKRTRRKIQRKILRKTQRRRIRRKKSMLIAQAQREKPFQLSLLSR